MQSFAAVLRWMPIFAASLEGRILPAARRQVTALLSVAGSGMYRRDFPKAAGKFFFLAFTCTRSAHSKCAEGKISPHLPGRAETRLGPAALGLIPSPRSVCLIGIYATFLFAAGASNRLWMRRAALSGMLYRHMVFFLPSCTRQTRSCIAS